MFFKKFSFFIASFSFIFLIIIFNFINFFRLRIKYFEESFKSFSNLNWVFSLDWISLNFLVMVFSVTFLICLYRESYLEHYNTKKFVFIIIFFLCSIVFLIIRNSFLNFIVGWDLLGISSLCLIMFYPNKTTLFNSVITIFFNRLGDVLLILSISFFIIKFSIFITFINFYEITIFIFILMICAFTKRAQFPLSSWLPAAMSAPTPISAIVHSSTLVTAGILLISKFLFILNYFCFLEILFYFSRIRFLLGGILSNSERDFKKVIAFSTISQIRLIILFCSLGLLYLSLSHMIFHAFFKTLLFCCAGFLFITKFNTQVERDLQINSKDIFLLSLFIIRIYSLRGLLFSSSFFSKDLVIETIISYRPLIYFEMLLFGRIITLLYCRKISSRLSYKTKRDPVLCFKNIFFFSILFFSFINVYCGFYIKFYLFIDLEPLVKKFNLLFILALFAFFVFSKKIIFFKYTQYMVSELGFIKNYSYSFWRNYIKTGRILNLISNRDHFIFKPSILIPVRFFNSKNKNTTLINFFIIFILIFLTYIFF